jgi:hypothetical protein
MAVTARPPAKGLENRFQQRPVEFLSAIRPNVIAVCVIFAALVTNHTQAVFEPPFARTKDDRAYGQRSKISQTRGDLSLLEPVIVIGNGLICTPAVHYWSLHNKKHPAPIERSQRLLKRAPKDAAGRFDSGRLFGVVVSQQPVTAPVCDKGVSFRSREVRRPAWNMTIPPCSNDDIRHVKVSDQSKGGLEILFLFLRTRTERPIVKVRVAQRCIAHRDNRSAKYVVFFGQVFQQIYERFSMAVAPCHENRSPSMLRLQPERRWLYIDVPGTGSYRDHCGEARSKPNRPQETQDHNHAKLHDPLPAGIVQEPALQRNRCQAPQPDRRRSWQ